MLQSLPEHPSARSACLAAGVSDDRLPVYEQALATLAQSEMIKEGAAS